MKDTFKKQAFLSEKIFLIYHESSHVFLYLKNLFYVRKLQINVNIENHQELTSSDQLAYTEYFPIYEGIKDNELKNNLLIRELHSKYAGFIAEKILYTYISGAKQLPRILKIGSNDDIKSAQYLIRKNNLASPGKETAQLKRNIQKEIEKLLINEWADIKLIANSIYKKKRLSFDELKYLLTRKSNNKIFWKEQFKKIIMINDNSTNEELLRKIFLNE